MNLKYLEEAKQLAERWKIFIDGTQSKVIPVTLESFPLVSLDCQRLHSETGNWDCCDDCKQREINKIRNM